MNQRTENTIILGKAGIINDPRFCIKGQTTCACVCPECMQEGRIRMDEWFKSIEQTQ